MSATQAGLIVHLFLISLAIGIGFTNLVNLRVARGQTGDVAKGLAMHRMALIPYGDAAVVLIVLSGLFLLVSIGGAAGLSTAFHVKMAAVLVWLVAYIAMRLTIRRMLATGNMALAARIGPIAQVAMTAIAVALICAVLTFAT